MSRLPHPIQNRHNYPKKQMSTFNTRLEDELKTMYFIRGLHTLSQVRNHDKSAENYREE